MKQLSIIAALAWMVLIFCMSAQPADLSGDISEGVSYLIMQVIDVIFGCGWNEVELLELAEVWEYPIRKIAHMTEFGVLSLLYLWVLRWRSNSSTVNKRYLIALLATMIYAATDEFHQIFVPGRAGLVTDVLIDTLGAIIALLISRGVGIIINRSEEIS